MHLHRPIVLIPLLNVISATLFKGRCGELNHPEFTDSGNHRLRYRQHEEAVTVTAIECPEYERHLKQEALELKQQIQDLEQKYARKIRKIVDLVTGKRVSRKYMASSFSCDARTGVWKLNRQAVFSCQSENSLEDSGGLATVFGHDGDESEKMISENDGNLIPFQTESSSLFQASEDATANAISRQINLNTFEAENATEVYTENLDQFLNRDVENKVSTGQLINGNDRRPLTFYFDDPIVKSDNADLKCSKLEFNLQGSEHTLDGKTFDGEIQLHCWVSEFAETLEEALAVASSMAEGSQSILKVFSFFVDKNAQTPTTQQESDGTSQHDNKLFASIIRSSVLAEQQQGSDFQTRIDHLDIDLPTVGEYFTYEGSLTHRKFADSPRVNWFVFEAPILANAAQFKPLDVNNGVHAGYVYGQHEIAQPQGIGIVRRYVLDNIRYSLSS